MPGKIKVSQLSLYVTYRHKTQRVRDRIQSVQGLRHSTIRLRSVSFSPCGSDDSRVCNLNLSCDMAEDGVMIDMFLSVCKVILNLDPVLYLFTVFQLSKHPIVLCLIEASQILTTYTSLHNQASWLRDTGERVRTGITFDCFMKKIENDLNKTNFKKKNTLRPFFGKT